MIKDNKEQNYLRKLTKSYFSSRAAEDAHRKEREMVYRDADYIVDGGEDPHKKDRENRARERGFSVGKISCLVQKEG